MSNTLNYAEKWQSELLKIVLQKTLTAPFIVTNVNWLNAKTFHFTQKSVSGFKAHSRDGGWNRGNITDTDVPYTVEHDRDVEFLIDKADVDETNQVASIQNTSEVFVATQQAPETDAYFFSKVATVAMTANRSTETALASWTSENVVSKLKALIRPCKIYKGEQGGLIAYVRSEIMDLLSLAKDFTRTISIASVGPEGQSIQTRITELDGVYLIEVLNDERFYTEFDFTDGFEKTDEAQAINVLVASPSKVQTVPKISSIYYFAPGAHTEGDGYLYQNRAFWDTFIMPNGLNNVIDAIYADIQPVPEVSA